jgi:uncharacterized NAD-dependent epimerase/dehydratase family protein
MIRQPYLLFLGDAPDLLAAKTAFGIAYWRPELCQGQLRLPGAHADLGLPDLSVAAAAAAGARTMVIGVANRGGTIAPAWQAVMLQALEAGLDLASGLHQRLDADPVIAAAAARLGRRLIDVRHPERQFRVGDGRPRTGRRLLTVGTDCSVGKMFTSLAIERELKQRAIAADFRATGQTGILIAGAGVPVDAVVADFIAGSVEELAPEAAADHWDVIEGQGSLFHPSYAGVSLGLLHGAQAEALVLCHEAGRPHMRGLPHYQVPALDRCMAETLKAATLTAPAARFVGISINTSALAADAAERLLSDTARQFGLPCVDAVRTGVAPIVEQMLAAP